MWIYQYKYFHINKSSLYDIEKEAVETAIRFEYMIGRNGLN